MIKIVEEQKKVKEKKTNIKKRIEELEEEIRNVDKVIMENKERAKVE